LDFDERMAMVVQKVVGRRWGDYFFPAKSFLWLPHQQNQDVELGLVSPSDGVLAADALLPRHTDRFALPGAM
jgi:hypothetical protein